MKRRKMNRPKISVHPRSLARSMARAEFERQGVTGYNDKIPTAPGEKPVSRFSLSWRKMAAEAASAAPRKKKGVSR